MTALALLLLLIGALLVHAALSGKTVPEILQAGLPPSSGTPGFGSKSVKS